MLWKTPASKKSERAELCATAKNHLRLVAGQEGGKPALVAVTGNLMLRFGKEKVKNHRFFLSNSISSLAQDECNGSREDIVEALLVVMRDKETLKTRY